MASYQQIAKRLKRLEDKRITISQRGDAHADEIARIQRLLAAREWSAPIQSIYREFIAWHEREIAQGRPYGELVTSQEGQWARERLDAKFNAMLSRVSHEELDAMIVELEQMVAEDGDE